jgi:hypothetical protein
MTPLQSTLVELRRIIESHGDPEALSVLSDVEFYVQYHGTYQVDALTLLRHATQAVEDDLGPDDPAAQQLRGIFTDVRTRMAEGKTAEVAS